MSPHVAVVASFEPRHPLPQLDVRTKKRLSTIPDPKHLNALLTASQRYRSVQISLISLSLETIWAERQDAEYRHRVYRWRINEGTVPRLREDFPFGEG